jgi:hypothetical protein
MKKRRASSPLNSTNSDERRSAMVPPPLPSRLERRVASYALAAGATGLGLLALAPPAKAGVIYTPANISISGFSTPFETEYFPIALNGQTQLTFSALFVIGTGCFFFRSSEGCAKLEAIGVKPASGNALALGPLARGYQIGPQAHFGGGAGIWPGIDSFAYGTRVCPIGAPGCNSGKSSFLSSNGPWAAKTGYLGVRFLIGGGTYYGWVALSVDQGTGEVTGYAYDTVANQPIGAGQTTATPEPGTLGLLALGSLGLGYWRRRKQAA